MMNNTHPSNNMANPNSNHLSESVQIYFSCKGLPDLDSGSSNTDPYLVVRIDSRPLDPTFHEIGRTETIKDSQCPEFTTSIPVQYFFEANQTIQVEVRDCDSNGSKFDLIGDSTFSLGSLACKGIKGSTYPILHKGKNRGSLTARLEKTSFENYDISFDLEGQNLTGFGNFSSLVPMIRIYREVGPSRSNNWIKIYESEYQNSDPVVRFNRISIPSQKLYGNDTNCQIKFEMLNYKNSGFHKPKGHFVVDCNQILEPESKINMKLNDPSKNRSAGTLLLSHSHKVKSYTFVDYLQGGLNMSLSTCIDFTASNGQYQSPQSLHSTVSGLNQYQKSIMSVVNILQNYDSDGMIQTYGFGGITNFPNLKSKNDANHFFPCSGDPSFTSGMGVQGVFELYENAKNFVSLSGPTYFAPLLKGMNQVTKAMMKSSPNAYNVLLILTDGTIHDDDQTIHELVMMSRLPCSVIIVGVGRGDFSDMVVLDGDGKKLKSNNGQLAQRDIVQFVKFNDYSTPEGLASAVLKEMPKQVTDYYKMIGQKPAHLM